MEQIKQLFEILKSTPELALWGVSMYFLFILLKLGSWVGALTITAKHLIKRYFDYRDKSQEIEQSKQDFELKKIHQSKAQELLDYFDKNTISNVSKTKLITLFNLIGSTQYIHNSDIDNAIKLLKENKDG